MIWVCKFGGKKPVLKPVTGPVSCSGGGERSSVHGRPHHRQGRGEAAAQGHPEASRRRHGHCDCHGEPGKSRDGSFKGGLIRHDHWSHRTVATTKKQQQEKQQKKRPAAAIVFPLLLSSQPLAQKLPSVSCLASSSIISSSKNFDTVTSSLKPFRLRVLTINSRARWGGGLRGWKENWGRAGEGRGERKRKSAESPESTGGEHAKGAKS